MSNFSNRDRQDGRQAQQILLKGASGDSLIFDKRGDTFEIISGEPSGGIRWSALIELCTHALLSMEYTASAELQPIFRKINDARIALFKDELEPMVAPAAWLPPFGREMNNKQWTAFERIQNQLEGKFDNNGIAVSAAAQDEGGAMIPGTRIRLFAKGWNFHLQDEQGKNPKFSALQLVTLACTVLADNRTNEEAQAQFSPMLAAALPGMKMENPAAEPEKSDVLAGANLPLSPVRVQGAPYRAHKLQSAWRIK